MKIKLVLLHPDMEERIYKFIGESPDLPSIFTLVDNDFIKTVKTYYDHSHGIDLPDNYVPYTVFYAIDIESGNIVGQISIRHKLNTSLKFRGGHIGYYVSPKYRNMGIGTQMLSKSIEYCKYIHLDKVLVTCDEKNIGSNQIILHNHGILDSKGLDLDEIRFNRYWIDVV